MTDDKSYPKTINPEYIALERIWDDSDPYSFEDYKKDHPDGNEPGHDYLSAEITWDELRNTIKNIDKNWARQYLVFNELEVNGPPAFYPSCEPPDGLRTLFSMHQNWKALEGERKRWKKTRQGKYLYGPYVEVCPQARLPIPEWLLMDFAQRVVETNEGKFKNLEEAFSLRHLTLTQDKRKAWLTNLDWGKELGDFAYTYLHYHPHCCSKDMAVKKAMKATKFTKSVGTAKTYIEEFEAWRERKIGPTPTLKDICDMRLKKKGLK